MGDEPECGGDCATAAEVAQERDEIRAHLDSITEQLQPVADRYDMDELDAEALAGQVSEDLDRLAAIEEQEREAKEQLAQETAELEAALGRIEEDATSERAETLAGWNTDALAEYNGIVTGIAKERGLIEAEAQADHSRVAGEGRDGQPARDGKRLTVGVPNPDGEWEA